MTKRARQVLALVCLGVFMGSIDNSVVNVAYPTLTAYFDVSLAVVGWVSVAYMLTRASLLAIFGRLSDIVGHKRVYMTGFAVFLAGSVLSGLAPTIGTLIAFRVVQAVGSAMLTANTVAIITLHVPRRRLGAALSMVEASVSFAIGIGPVIGGLLIQALSWRWIFFINVPISLTALWLAARLLPPMRGEVADEPFDALGAATFALGLGGVLMGISLGQGVGWLAPLTVSLVGCGALLLVWFVRVERRARRPMVDLTLFARRTYAAANIAKVFAYAGGFAVMFTLPFYLEDLLHYAPAAVGLAMIPMPAAMAAGSLVGGPLSDRLGSRLLAPLGMAVGAAGCLMFAHVSPGRSEAGLFAAMVTVEVGLGLFVSPNDNMIMQSAPADRVGVVSGVLALMRNLGMIFGITFAAVLLQARTAAHLHAASPAPSQLAAATLAGMHDVYGVTALVFLAGVLLSLLR